MIIYIRVLLLALFVASATSDLDEFVENLNTSIRKLKLRYDQTLEELYYRPLRQANELEHSGEASGEVVNAMRKISNTVAEIEAIRFACRRSSVESVKKVLAATKEESQSLREVLIHRTAFRGLVTAFWMSFSQWQLLHKLLEHYVSSKTDKQDQLLVLASSIYLERHQFIELSSTKHENFGISFEDYMEANPESTSNRDEVSLFGEFDEIIDRAIGCEHCKDVNMGPLEDENAKTLIDSKDSLKEVMEEYVESELLHSIEQMNEQLKGKVPEFTVEELSQVGIEEIEELDVQVLKQLDLWDSDWDL